MEDRLALLNKYVAVLMSHFGVMLTLLVLGDDLTPVHSMTDHTQ